MNAAPVFSVRTPLGFAVEVEPGRWREIVSFKHPAMKGREKEVVETLQCPDSVRVSVKDPAVYLFYQAVAPRRWICAVVKDRKDGTAFLITCYPADAVKKGGHAWPC